MVISASLQACGVVFPLAMPTSICRSIVTICSGLYLLIGMTRFSSKWILSHSTWYKFRRSRQAIFSQGDASDEVFYVQKGKVRLTILSKSGKEATLGILTTANFLGEGCLIGQPQRM